MSNYYYKYLKYKNKYRQFIKLYGGTLDNSVPELDNSIPELDNYIPELDNSIPELDNYIPEEVSIYNHFNMVNSFYKYIISSHGESSKLTFIIPSNIELYFFNTEGSCLTSVNKQQTKICNNTLTENDFKLQKKLHKNTYFFHKYTSGKIINNYKLSKDRNSNFNAGIIHCNIKSNNIIYDISRLHTGKNDFLYFDNAIKNIVEWHIIEFLKKNITMHEKLDMYAKELDKLEEPIRIYCLFCRE